MKFKIGDRVRIVQDETLDKMHKPCRTGVIAGVGSIYHHSETGSPMYMVMPDDGLRCGGRYHFYDFQLRLLENGLQRAAKKVK